MEHLRGFNESNDDKFLQSLLLMKEKIKSIELDIDKYDKETIKGRLKAISNQAERLIEKYEKKA